MKREILDKMRMASHRFTIEQFELLRRLRASGITKDEVVLAFENFDRVEWELQVGRGLLRSNNGGRLSVSATSPPQINGGRMPMHVRDTERTLSSEKEHHHHPNGNGTHGEHNGRPKSSAQSTGACSVSSNEDSSATEGREQMTPPLRLTNKTPPPHRGSTDSSSLLPSMLGATDSDSIQATAAALFASLPLMATPHAPHTPNSIPNSQLAVVAPQTPVSWSGDSGSMVPYLPDEYCSPDVEKLKRKGEEALLSEIRSFVMQYNIKQTMIAEMTKMSQAYVSRFFRGDIVDMSERTKNTFYQWYLTCKNNPLKYGESDNNPSSCPSHPGVKRMVSENGDLIPLKRERFTFKSAHLAVLERYYERDPYPDGQTREQIVDECNAAVERPDRPLSDREKVSLPVVNNWFNNRRKEAKKQMRQQHGKQSAAAVAQQEAATAPAFAAGAALLAMQQGWQQQLLQNNLSVFAGAAGQPGASPPPQPQPLSLQPPMDDDDSRGSYSIPEEAMAIDFSEGGAAAREREASKVNELKIKQEAVS
ncbi:uncharacterized protein LOC108864548 [Galendromus occidentalis]|uniref:Uncharacterized protein LOC108864548 n=1 Tax=Galendromus occidentalis TaxID=34638 RepID=A0AAJ7SH61_9ACAR|nr:uncharacterized protein LOC108864548 [Galendromus occidentalis]